MISFHATRWGYFIFPFVPYSPLNSNCLFISLPIASIIFTQTELPNCLYCCPTALTLTYSSGSRATLPVSYYEGITPPYWDQRDPGWNFPIEVDDNAYGRQEMSAVNGFKLKDYFRIDASYTFHCQRSRWSHELTVSVFNLLNWKNPYLYYHSDEGWRQLSIMPVMPNIRWAIEF